jgi:DNA-binding LacI/PurR family transcriptional regulator
VLCLTDQLARATIEAAASLGLRVPRDLSVTGFDDLPEAALTDPPLTTVHQDHEAKGTWAARALLEPRGDDGVLLPARLVVRASSAPPRG